jgi:Tol biopolymer transport system component
MSDSPNRHDAGRLMAKAATIVPLVLVAGLMAGCGSKGLVNQQTATTTSQQAATTTSQLGSNRIVLASEADGDWEVIVVYLETQMYYQLTSNLAYDFEPVWSPDGSRIAFTSDYLLGKITPTTRPSDDDGSTSPEIRTETGDRDILIMDNDGSNLVRLGLKGANDEQPAWSPDGSRIAFVSDRAGGVNIWVMDRDGSNVRQLTDSPRENWMPAWSPDGSTIAFVSNRSGLWEVHLVDAAGGNLRQITSSEQQINNWGPVWSPDGSTLAYARAEVDDFWDLYTMAADGSNVQQLTDRNGTDFEPVWSPDGGTIAFGSDRSGQMEVHLISLDDSSVEPVGVSGIPSDWTERLSP